jgi:hypothetical protein
MMAPDSERKRAAGPAHDVRGDDVDFRGDDVGRRAHAAIVAGDWAALRPLLHPYLQWTDGDGRTVRGRSKVLAMLERAGRVRAPARSIELRDGQIYRWRA